MSLAFLGMPATGVLGYWVARTGSRRSLPQTIAAQAIPAIDGNRQAGNFFGAPARPGQIAGEFRSASGTSEAARGLNFQPICHESNRTLAVFFMSGSSRTAVYSNAVYAQHGLRKVYERRDLAPTCARGGEIQRNRDSTKKCGPGQTRRLIFNHFPQHWICHEVREDLAVGRFLGHFQSIHKAPWPRNRASQTPCCRRNADEKADRSQTPPLLGRQHRGAP